MICKTCHPAGRRGVIGISAGCSDIFDAACLDIVVVVKQAMNTGVG